MPVVPSGLPRAAVRVPAPNRSRWLCRPVRRWPL